MRTGKIPLLLGVLILACALTGCSAKVIQDAAPSPIPTAGATKAPEPTREISLTEEPDMKDTPEPTTISEPVATSEPTQVPATPEPTNEPDIIGSMTLREKILQMCVTTTEELGNWDMTSAGEKELAALKEYPVGGVIFFEDQLQDPEQTRELLAQLQAYAEQAGLPKLFLCVDEEGGKVARIANNPAFGIDNPGPMKNITTVEDALEAGRYIGKYLSDLGFNVDFAPDADVLTAPGSKIIGNRSFGDDPQKVTEYAAAVSDGLHEYGILSCFKHFPGHGAVEADTHEGLAYTDKSLEDLMACEIIPFAKAGELDVDMVMAAHISVPAILGDNTPCSLSEYMLTTVLKEQLGYDGLVITDALNMGAVTKDLAEGEAAVMAVKAGVDILLMPPDLDAAVEAIEEAVANGEITEERIDEAVKKILLKKKSMGN